MDVKGVAYLAREKMMVESFGEARWRSFCESTHAKVPFFKSNPILAISQIPVPAFLAFNDEMLRVFYEKDPQTYWTFGERSAHFALTEGQLKNLFKRGDFQRFLDFAPTIWKGYFTEGTLAVRHDPPWTVFHITNLPMRHVYFELAVMGFVWGGLKVLGAIAPQRELVRGFSTGHQDIMYRFKP